MVDNEKMKLLTNIREKITAFFPTDDNRLDGEYIWEQCKLARNIIIEKLFQDNKRNVNEFFQRITLDVLDYDETDEPDLPELKRSLIPPLINLDGNIRFIGPKDRSAEYNSVSLDGIFHQQGRDFTSGNTFYVHFRDRVFFSQIPADTDDVAYTELGAWVLLEDPEDDPDFDTATDTLVPKKYQTLLEDKTADNIIKYHNQGILSRENDATDIDSNTKR